MSVRDWAGRKLRFFQPKEPHGPSDQTLLLVDDGPGGLKAVSPSRTGGVDTIGSYTYVHFPELYQYYDEIEVDEVPTRWLKGLLRELEEYELGVQEDPV